MAAGAGLSGPGRLSGPPGDILTWERRALGPRGRSAEVRTLRWGLRPVLGPGPAAWSRRFLGPGPHRVTSTEQEPICGHCAHTLLYTWYCKPSPGFFLTVPLFLSPSTFVRLCVVFPHCVLRGPVTADPLPCATPIPLSKQLMHSRTVTDLKVITGLV